MRVREIEHFCVVKVLEGSRYFVHCCDVRTLKWYIDINHVAYFIYAGSKLKIVLLSHTAAKYVDKIFKSW